jgi:hypothetical protein
MSDVNPQSMTTQQLADFLTKVGPTPVTVEEIESDLAAGAPKNDDGTMSLLHYAAWLVGKKS